MVPALFVLACSDTWRVESFPSPRPSGLTVELRTLEGRLSPEPEEPKTGWRFDQVTELTVLESATARAKARVFGRSETSSPATPASVARLMGRLLDCAYTELGMRGGPYADQSLSIYLCEGGKAGAEQFLSANPDGSRVDTLLVYQSGSLTRLEACREIAHELGHAVLPAIRVRGGREEWANGDLGERLFLPWLATQMRAGRLAPQDALGVTPDQLDAYARARVLPLADRVANEGPSAFHLQAEGDRAFEGFLAMACHVFRTLPVHTFRRTLLLLPELTPRGYAKAVLEAVSEEPRLAFRTTVGKAVWLPVASGSLAGCKLRSRSKGWAKVLPQGTVVLTNRQ